MFSFLNQREIFSLSFTDEGTKESFRAERDLKKTAVSKISTFWAFNGTSLHLLGDVDRKKFVGDKDPFSSFYSMFGAVDGWSNCPEQAKFTFRIPRWIDIVTLLKITGKGIWKVSLVVGSTKFAIYTKKKNRMDTFCVKLPFSLPVYAMQFTVILIVLHGEEVSSLKVKGGQMFEQYRDRSGR
ncbi:hypothetical protein [Brazilian marseillevirus]|uniref:hypothetical protein n=1 Tax=Brazilian marseillevirus TaxID=1813599 RepID=UPI0007842411|nr:hypothetical protein A3303_gp107 [Brazilian marseillevirus]AMQ10615.1 hypothetical protein [Brazilian marseillevirus]